MSCSVVLVRAVVVLAVVSDRTPLSAVSQTWTILSASFAAGLSPPKASYRTSETVDLADEV
jgi:hypothetical protein